MATTTTAASTIENNVLSYLGVGDISVGPNDIAGRDIEYAMFNDVLSTCIPKPHGYVVLDALLEVQRMRCTAIY